MITDSLVRYAKLRVMKLSKGQSNHERYEKILEKVAKNPDHLHINIIDEAHHSTTCNQNVNTMYQKYINPWNSEDHPNVINIYVSATPWNLMTDISRFQHDVTIGLNSDKKYEFSTSLGDERKKLKNPTALFDIKWTQAHHGDFKKGKEVRLMVTIPIFSKLGSEADFEIQTTGRLEFEDS